MSEEGNSDKEIEGIADVVQEVTTTDSNVEEPTMADVVQEVPTDSNIQEPIVIIDSSASVSAEDKSLADPVVPVSWEKGYFKDFPTELEGEDLTDLIPDFQDGRGKEDLILS